MKNGLYQINYSMYAKQKRELVDFIVNIDDLDKTTEVIVNTHHTFICNFSFFEERDKTCIKYKIKGTLKLICQDTLENFDYALDTSNCIIIVEDDRLTNDSLNEPFICKSSIIDLRDIIKEEILLDLPLVPKKDTNSCKNTKKRSYYSEQENVVEEKRNPFEILKTLK